MKRPAARLALALLALALLVFGVRAALAALAPADQRWIRVARRDLVIEVPVEGELRAADSAQLGPPQLTRVWNFKIAFLAPEGVDVASGQPVIRFDTTRLDQQLAERRAERDAAAKELEKAETDLLIERRDKELRLAEARARARRAELKLSVPEDVASRTELAQARIDRRLAALEISALERSLLHLAKRGAAEIGNLRETRDRHDRKVRELESQIEQMTVAAPRAGTVVYIAENNEKPKVGDSVWRARKIVEIPALDDMLADGEVAEADAGRLAPDQPVSLRLDAYPDRVYTGTVRSVRQAVQRKSVHDPAKVVKLVIALSSTDVERMRPGMRFRGRVEVDRLADVLQVPEDALFSAPGGGAAVYVRTLLGRRAVRPAFGARNDDAFEVRDGLREGQWVLQRAEGEAG